MQIDSKILTLTLTGDFYFIYAYFYFLIFKSQHKTKKKNFFFITEPENRNIYKPSKQRKEEEPEDSRGKMKLQSVALSQLWLRRRNIRRTAEISTHRVQTVGTTISVTICMWLRRGSEMGERTPRMSRSSFPPDTGSSWKIALCWEKLGAWQHQAL